MHTTVYSRCPSCQKDALVQPVQASYRCASCNYDYVALARDDAAREQWMLTNLRLGSLNQVFVLHLHQLVLQLSAAESNERVIAFAAKHGIVLPSGKPMSPSKIVAIAIGSVVLLIALLAIVGIVAR